MRRTDMSFSESVAICVVVFLAFLALNSMCDNDAKAKDRETEGRVKTVYDVNGRPVNQSEAAKGWHRVTGTVTLSSGEATVTLNTDVSQGRQDVSFLTDSSYYGTAQPLLAMHRGNVYRVLPLSGIQCKVISSDTGDTATIRYLLEGE